MGGGGGSRGGQCAGITSIFIENCTHYRAYLLHCTSPIIIPHVMSYMYMLFNVTT